MSVLGCSAEKTKPHFDYLQKFLDRPLPDVLTEAAAALDAFGLLESPVQALERVTLALDLAGSECFKFVTCLPEKVRVGDRVYTSA